MTLTELKARATELGLTPDEVRAYGSLSYKATWEQAINEFEQWKESVNTHCEQFDIPQWTYSEDETVEDITVTVNQGESICQRICKAFNCVECPDCEGLGDILNCLNQFELCIRCDGSGMVPNSESNEGFISKLVSNEWGSQDYVTVLCPSCYGSGIPQRTEETEEELPFEPTHTLINGEWVEIENKAVSNSITPIQGLPVLPFTFTPTKPCEPDNSGYLVFDKKLGNWVKEKLSESSTPYRDKLIAKMSGYVDKGVTLSALEDMQKNPPDEHTAAIYLGLLEESEQMLKEALAA